MFKRLVAAFAAFFMSACVTMPAAQASEFVATKNRTVYISGEIKGNALDTATEISNLAEKDSNLPIDIVISSPGGSVEAGLQILSAMDAAKARGIKVRCFVPLAAASMAFQIFNNCDERYALKYALLLFHPARVTGTFTADDAYYNSEQLRATEMLLMGQLLDKLGMDYELFMYHYRHETMWLASILAKTCPNYMTLVDGYRNVNRPFDYRE